MKEPREVQGNNKEKKMNGEKRPQEEGKVRGNKKSGLGITWRNLNPSLTALTHYASGIVGVGG